MSETPETVLLADDDAGCRALYTAWLEADYEIRTAADGTAALEQMDDDVDLVVLDREMPRKDGEAVAAAIDAGDNDPFVVMISGVEPGVDLLDIPVDDYLTKPVQRESVLAVAERAATLSTCQARLQQFLALASRKECLETHVHPAELSESDAYRCVVRRLERERAAVEEALDAAVSTPDTDNPDASTLPGLSWATESP
ncbi:MULTISPECIES: response regulator [Haloarcula]|uniref:DNA-binding protein n=1 Tax=Haloarcula pellucida TaxID=1427151 RepID=A0A830GHR7_9EURY|nr:MULTISPECIES: response regulator [Halomicroarcula]MBX0347218.1 response regulator [Halomicroarcula pellucida]MDS0276907.1 response regulator [Halomicroarcula sp. S1AR25-4]GGN87578.1 DNA-binding protein [Halomicroarcula pellucida]